MQTFMNNQHLRRLFLGTLVTVACVLRPDAAPLTKDPYLQAPGPESITIMWETSSDEPGQLRFGEGTKLDHTVGPIKPVRMASPTAAFYLYEADLTKLKPGTTYHYEASVGTDRSETKRFRTFSKDAPTTTFIAYGDTRTDPAKHTALAALFRRYSPEFILHSGDLVAKGTDHALWGREFFDPLRNVIDEVPLLPSIGNHEQDGANYIAYFHHPGDQRFFYSCDIGPVHVVTLDSRFAKASDPQYAFVQADLKASNAPWKIVMLHEPMFNFGGHASLWGHDAYLPLFHETHVDMVLAGHSHLYERFRPLVPKDQPGAWAIQHVTTGGGGAPLASSVPDPSLVSTVKCHHFIVFTATRDHLEGKCINIEGKEFDHFTLRKENGRQPKDYLAAECTEEDVTAAVKHHK